MAARTCYYTNESFFERDSQQYVVALITENEAGYEPTDTYRELGEAIRIADKQNAELGLSADDVSQIVTSSMRLSQR
ncbi:hypothetical protein [Mycobacteroides abscessus]|uniref:hypothetical protein n=1 Tax=Mycobacteroides abscessus TaxID=36809 RepID=UPI0018965227